MGARQAPARGARGRKVLGCVAAAAVVLVALTTAAAPAGAGDLELQFLDARPIVIDLDDLDDLGEGDTRWRVDVFNGQPGGPHILTMHVLFDPAGVILVEQKPVAPVATGAVASFAIALGGEQAGSGQLVVTSTSGAAARRDISVRSPTAEARLPVTALRFTGTRAHPFGGGVRVPSLEVPGAPGGSSGPVRIGTVVSDSGDVANVVRSDDTFDVHGIEGPGNYSGTADLTPGSAGGEAEVEIDVRDAAGWPLGLLLLGLGAVQGLERYQKRVRPRRELALRLAHLKDRARMVQRQVGRPLLICSEPGQPDLLLDIEAARALEAWDRARTEAERSVWDFGGPSFTRLAGAVDDFARLAHEHADLESRRQRVVDRLLPADRAPAERALEDSPVGEALRARRFVDVSDIADAAQELEAATAFLDRFCALYEQLEQLARFGDDTVRTGAEVLRSKLLTPGVDIGPLKEEVEALLKAWRPAPTRVEQPAAATRAMVPPSAPPSSPRPAPSPSAAPAPVGPTRARRHARRPRGLPLVAGSLAALVAVLLAVSTFGGQSGDDAGSPFGAGSGPGSGAGAPGGADEPAGGAAPAPAALPAPPPRGLPEAPVSASGSAPPADPTAGEEPGGGAFALSAYLVPLAAASALLGGILVLAGRLRRRRRPDDLDSARLDRLLASEDKRFALASGLFVVATGMSLLYVPNPTFGGPGDYLTVALWGAGVGEGIQLARRVLPGLPGR